ncbi:MAG: phosphotransferase [Candidatus Cryptobacteroides sp.]
MKAIEINLDDYVLSGGGFNGESYDSKQDPSIMLKLYFPGKITQPLDEMTLARKVYDLGIPTPEPGEYVVTKDGRYGIRFHRIVGKKSIARACGENPEQVEKYACEFARMCKQLHSTVVNPEDFEDIKDRYIRLLEQNPFFTTGEKDKLSRFICDAPDTHTAIHGDLQFGNVIFKDDKYYFIDLGDFCHGYSWFDLGMVYLTCIVSDDKFRSENFHMDTPTAARFWEHFAANYFGSERPLKDIEEEIRPYAGLKALIIERDANCPKTDIRKTLDSILL